MNSQRVDCQSFECRQDMIHSFAQGTLSESDCLRFESHLNDCAECRQALDQCIASPQAWEALQACLSDRGNGPNDKCSVENPSSTLQDDLFYYQKLLGPTDDPHMLGRIAHYEIVGVLGRGGTGIVFKGFDASLNRFVAIKLMQPAYLSSETAKQRFHREAQSAAAVVNDHVVAIHANAEWQGIPYLVMTYIRGESLQKRIAKRGKLGLREVLRIGMQIAAGLAAAHNQGLIHRDIKPANILLESDVDRVKITDFGLARAIDDVRLTCTDVLIGTPMYMSPEQARDDSLDVRTDLFSFGSVLYEACTGQPPFEAATSYGVIRKVIDSEPTPIRVVDPDVPEWLERIVNKLMTKSPDTRFQSAGEVASLLQQCLAHVEQPRWVPLPPVLTQKNFSSSKLFTLSWRITMSVSIATVVGVIAWMFLAAPIDGDQYSVQVVDVVDVSKMKMDVAFDTSRFRNARNQMQGQAMNRSSGSGASGGTGGSLGISGSVSGGGSSSGSGKSGSKSVTESKFTESSNSTSQSSERSQARSFGGEGGGASGGASGGFVGGFASGGGVASGGGFAGGGGVATTYLKPNIGIALDVISPNKHRKEIVTISQVVQAVGDNGKDYSVNREVSLLNFPEFESSTSGKHFVYLSVPDAEVKKLKLLDGIISVTPGRVETIEFEGTKKQTVTANGRSYKLHSVQEENGGIRVSTELPLSESASKASSPFEKMQATQASSGNYRMEIEDSHGEMHASVGGGSAGAVSSFRGSSFNQGASKPRAGRPRDDRTKSNQASDGTQESSQQYFTFRELPEKRTIKKVILRMKEPTGETVKHPFSLHEVQIR
ncbi:MAG: protein kinase [Pirellula sp.]